MDIQESNTGVCEPPLAVKRSPALPARLATAGEISLNRTAPQD